MFRFVSVRSAAGRREIVEFRASGEANLSELAERAVDRISDDLKKSA